MAVKLISRNLLRGGAALYAILALALAGPAAAKDGPGNSDSHGNAEVAHANSGPENANASTDRAASPSHQGAFLAAITPQPTGSTAALIFTNTGSRAGAAVVTLFAADTGLQLATFTTASVPSLGSLSLNVTDIIAGATPALTAAQAASVLNAGVSAGFRGNVQLIGVSATDIANLSACGKSLESADNVLGNVAGPGNSRLTDAVRIVNDGAQAGHVVLSIRDDMDPGVLGTWTSPDVPSHGSLTVSIAAIAAAATPVVPATKTMLVVIADHLGAGLSLQHLSQVKGTTAIADVSAACVMHGGVGHMHDDETEESGDDASGP